MRQLWWLGAMIFALVPATLLHAGVVTFDFQTDVGKATMFTDTVGGLSATFSSFPDPGGFSIQASVIFQSLTGNFLIDFAPEDLTIVFDAPQDSISLNFATSGPGTLNISAFIGGTGGTIVGSNSASGTTPGGAFTLPEGVLSFNGGKFDTVVLSAASANFAIDDVTVSSLAVGAPTDAPEPGSLMLGAAALAALSLVQLRRHWTSVKPGSGTSIPKLTVANSALFHRTSIPCKGSLDPRCPQNVSSDEICGSKGVCLAANWTHQP